MKIKRSKSLSPEPSSSKDIKRIKLEEIANLNGITSLNILEFSDDVLLNILKYLHPQDLMAISLWVVSLYCLYYISYNVFSIVIGFFESQMLSKICSISTRQNPVEKSRFSSKPYTSRWFGSVHEVFATSNNQSSNTWQSDLSWRFIPHKKIL